MSRLSDQTAEIAHRLFSHMYLCEGTKVNLSLLQERPTNVEYAPDPYAQSQVGNHLIATPGVSVSEKTWNEEGLLDMLFGVSRSTVGEQYYQAVGATAIDRAWLTAAQLAELIYKKGSITLLNAKDSAKVYTDVGMYLDLINERMAIEPHYEPPPAEDMEAFRTLYRLIESMAQSYTRDGSGNTAMAKLFKAISGSGTVSGIDLDKSKVVFQGLSKPTLQPLTNPDAYKFNPSS